MTKKHYVALAAIVSDLRTSETNRAEIACKLADYFQTENKQFDRARFLLACGVEVTK